MYVKNRFILHGLHNQEVPNVNFVGQAGNSHKGNAKALGLNLPEKLVGWKFPQELLLSRAQIPLFISENFNSTIKDHQLIGQGEFPCC